MIRNFIEETPQALMQMEAWLTEQNACDVYLVIADETKRLDAIKVLSDLRNAGIKADTTMAPLKINKQFQKAEQSGARFAIVFGQEYPELKVKILESRTEATIHANTSVVDAVLKMLDGDDGPILA